jgi:hypothetical protein
MISPTTALRKARARLRRQVNANIEEIPTMKVHGSTSSIYSNLFQSQSSTDSDDSTPFTLPGDDGDEQATASSTTGSTSASSIANSISSAFWTNQTTSTDMSSAASTSTAVESTDTTDDTSSADLLSEFAKLANMTPAEKIRDQYLKEHNLTEEQFSQLSPDEQKAINDQIADEIKQQLGAGKGDGSDAENETASALSIA